MSFQNNSYHEQVSPQKKFLPDNTPSPVSSSWSKGWLAWHESSYVKGLLLGAGVTWLLTNSNVQRSLVKGAVTLWTSIQGGVEEVKEQIQDIKSEMSQSSDKDKD